MNNATNIPKIIPRIGNLPVATQIREAVEISELKWPFMSEEIVRDIATHLIPALDYPGCDWVISDIITGLCEERLEVLLVKIDGHHIATLAGEIDERNQALVIIAAGGEAIDQWMDEVMEVGIGLARHHGMKRILFRGREGWRRKIRALGFRPIFTAYEYEMEL